MWQYITDRINVHQVALLVVAIYLVSVIFTIGILKIGTDKQWIRYVVARILLSIVLIVWTTWLVIEL
jgi:hypothetical protein